MGILNHILWILLSLQLFLMAVPYLYKKNGGLVSR
jgi:hypothetical protein